MTNTSETRNTVPTVLADSDNVREDIVLPSVIGKPRLAIFGARVEIRNNVIQSFDNNGVLRIRIEVRD
ncbi:hypothetical protein [Burkholderia ubonensis]|uniref:hypothetical protein n=1 Tax=Burkholderia ubonensis TaxID=101571 RepID=UPI0012F7E9E5|nr:hypothetical protein [Burkholderia ubonensis]